MTSANHQSQPVFVEKLWNENISRSVRGALLLEQMEESPRERIKALRVPRSVADWAFQKVREGLAPQHITSTTIKACWLPTGTGREGRTRQVLDDLFKLSEKGEHPEAIEARVTEDLKPPQRIGLGELGRLLEAPMSDGLLADLFARTLRRYPQNHFQSNRGEFFVKLVAHSEAGRQTLQTAARMIAASYKTTGQQPHARLMGNLDFLQQPTVRETFLEKGGSDMLLCVCSCSPDLEERRQAFLKLAKEDPHRAFGFLEGLVHSRGEWPQWLEAPDLTVFLRHSDQQIRQEALRWMRNLPSEEEKFTCQKNEEEPRERPKP